MNPRIQNKKLLFEGTSFWKLQKAGKTGNRRKSAGRKQDQKDIFSRTENDSLNSEQLPTIPWLTTLEIYPEPITRSLHLP